MENNVWYKRFWNWVTTPPNTQESQLYPLNSIHFRPHPEMRQIEEQPTFRERARTELTRRKTVVARQARSHIRASRIVSTLGNAEFRPSMLDLFHRWKNDDLTKEVRSMPREQRLVFEYAWTGATDLKFTSISNSEIKHLVKRKDKNGRTPLHYACSMGHFKPAQWLLESGADPSATDFSSSITPLTCSAVCGSQSTMKLLLDNGADVNFGLDIVSTVDRASNLLSMDEEFHTALFWAVRARNLESVRFLLNNGAAIAGSVMHKETAFHEASYLGAVAILELLLNYCTNPTFLDLRGGPVQNTPLHIAVEQGHSKCVELLLAHGADADSMNISGQTPLHTAASIGDDEAILQLILQGKANVNAVDNWGRSPLHCCIPASTKGCDTSGCVELLLRHDADNNLQDSVGCTPFHLAMLEKSVLIAPILLRAGTDLTIKTKSGQSGLELLIKKMPHAMRYVKDSLDLSIDSHDKDVWDPYCSVIMNFRAIVPTSDRKVPAILEYHKEMEFLSSVCANGYKEILAHPLIEAFLILKWQRLRKYFWASFISNLLMVITYSWIIISIYKHLCPISKSNESCDRSKFENETSENFSNQDTQQSMSNGTLFALCIILMIMLIMFGIKEFLQMIQNPFAYIKNFENYVQTGFIVIAVITAWPATCNKSICCKLHKSFYSLAALGILNGWLLILFRFGKMPQLGLYVQMLLKVIMNFGIFMIAYASILIAFGLSFSIILHEHEDFTTVQDAIHSVIVMMTGEFQNYRNTTLHDKVFADTLHITNFVMLSTFVLLITIVLMNLLVGLAVSDIQGLHRGAKVARLSRLVTAISQLESLLFSKPFAKIFPQWLIVRLQRNALIVTADCKAFLKFRPHDPNDQAFPQAIGLQTVRIIEERRTKKASNSLNEDVEVETNEKVKSIESVIENLAGRINDIHNLLTIANNLSSPDGFGSNRSTHVNFNKPMSKNTLQVP